MADSNENTTNAPSDAPVAEDNPTYDPFNVFVNEVKYNDGTQQPYEPFKIPEEDRHKAKFAMPNDIECTVEAVSEMYISDKFINTFTKRSNYYSKMKKCNHTKFTNSDTLLCIAMIYYMGIVVLPAKEDYWPKSNSSLWPIHEISKHLSAWRFRCWWLNCSLDPNIKDRADAVDSGEEEAFNNNDEFFDANEYSSDDEDDDETPPVVN